MSSQPLVAIQVVNYKTKSYLESLLKDLFEDLKDADFTYQINIVDNNSGDDLSDLERKYFSFKTVNFYSSKTNLGFGGGHNYLATKTNATYLLILNTDLRILEKDTTKRLLDIISSDATIKVVGPKLLTNKGVRRNRPQVWDHGDPVPFLPKNFIYQIWVNRRAECEVDWVSGAVFLVEHTAFKNAGGFDEKIFLYGEEVDLCINIRQQGGRVLYCPEIHVFHYGSVVGRKSAHYKQSIRYLLDKHRKGKMDYYLMKLIMRIIPSFLFR